MVLHPSSPTISTISPYDGTYCALFDSVGEFLEQDNVNAPVDDIVSFSVWLESVASPWGDKVDILITYTDDTTTAINNLTGGAGFYTERDLTGYLTSGKISKKVKITLSYKDSGMRVDDFILVGVKKVV